jgi:hypothetical protein
MIFLQSFHVDGIIAAGDYSFLIDSIHHRAPRGKWQAQTY